MCVLCTTARVQSVETSSLFLGTIKNESFLKTKNNNLRAKAVCNCTAAVQ